MRAGAINTDLSPAIFAFYRVAGAALPRFIENTGIKSGEAALIWY